MIEFDSQNHGVFLNVWVIAMPKLSEEIAWNRTETELKRYSNFFLIPALWCKKAFLKICANPAHGIVSVGC